MNAARRKEIIATLIKAKRPDLANRISKNAIQALSPGDVGYDDMAKAIHYMMVANKHLVRGGPVGKGLSKKLTKIMRELDTYM